MRQAQSLYCIEYNFIGDSQILLRFGSVLSYSNNIPNVQAFLSLYQEYFEYFCLHSENDIVLQDYSK